MINSQTLTIIILAAILITVIIAGLKIYGLLKLRLHDIDKGIIDRPTGSNLLISSQQAFEMIKSYQNDLSRKKTRSGHLQRNDLDELFQHYEKELGVRGFTLSGIEYFFAQYPDNHSSPNKGQQTIIMFPTVFNGKVHIPVVIKEDKITPVSIKNGEVKDGKSLNVVPYLRVNQKKSNTSSANSSLLAANHSQMSPPRFP